MPATLAPGLEAVLASPQFIEDPYPAYQQILEESPIWRAPHGKYFAASHVAVNEILRDPVRFPQPEDPNPSFHSMDPPDHTRLRGLVSKAFSVRATERLRTRIGEIVESLLEGMEPDTETDLVQSLSFPLPTTMISGMLGVPLADSVLWEGWANRIHDATAAPRFLPEQDELVSRLRADARAAAVEEQGYFRTLVEARRRHPGPDLISELAAIEESGDRLTEDELVITMVLLLGGGHHTSVNLISSCATSLLGNPDQLDAVKANPDLFAAAVEETLRYDPPLQSVDRLVKETTEVGGVELEEGARVTLLLAAANRDPDVFQDPNEFQVGRPDVNRNISFGLGVHFCLGAPLARTEGEVALRSLFGRFPDLHLVPGRPPRRDGRYILRGFSSVPVRLGARR